MGGGGGVGEGIRFQFHKGTIRTNDNPASLTLSVISIP